MLRTLLPDVPPSDAPPWSEYYCLSATITFLTA